MPIVGQSLADVRITARKRPYSGHRWMSQKCQLLTHAPQQTTDGTRRSAPQSTTSSARISIAGGIVRPSVSTFLLLMARRKTVGCSNGRLAGGAPTLSLVY